MGWVAWFTAWYRGAVTHLPPPPPPPPHPPTSFSGGWRAESESLHRVTITILKSALISGGLSLPRCAVPLCCAAVLCRRVMSAGPACCFSAGRYPPPETRRNRCKPDNGVNFIWNPPMFLRTLPSTLLSLHQFSFYWKNFSRRSHGYFFHNNVVRAA